jgi:hypothetical protein
MNTDFSDQRGNAPWQKENGVKLECERGRTVNRPGNLAKRVMVE